LVYRTEGKNNTISNDFNQLKCNHMLSFSAYVSLHLRAHHVLCTKDRKMSLEEMRDQEHALLLNNPEYYLYCSTEY